MNSIVQDYEQEFSALCAEITTLSGKLKLSTRVGETDEIVEKLDSLFIDAEETLEQIELESHNLESQAKERAGKNISTYRQELKKFRSLYESCKIESSERAARLELFSNSTAEFNPDSSEKDLLLENEDVLNQSGQQLDTGRRILRETEDIGAGVLADLENQRETLQRSRDRVKDMENGLGEGSAILSRMMFRARQNRIILFSIVCVITFLLIYGLYRIFAK